MRLGERSRTVVIIQNLSSKNFVSKQTKENKNECLKQTSTLQNFAFVMKWMKYHVVSSFVTYGSFFMPARGIKNTIVRNSFSAVVYTACNITHTIEKPIAALSVGSESFFSVGFT